MLRPPDTMLTRFSSSSYSPDKMRQGSPGFVDFEIINLTQGALIQLPRKTQVMKSALSI
jgi:hypothetical protein